MVETLLTDDMYIFVAEAVVVNISLLIATNRVSQVNRNGRKGKEKPKHKQKEKPKRDPA